jgi:hypothetical protein
MATAGSIVIDLLLKSGSFSTDTQRSAKELAKLKKEALDAGRALGESIRNVAAAAGVGISVAAFTNMITASIDAADHLNDLSKKTGIAVETLGGIGFAAKQAGGDLDSAAAGIGKLNKTIAEAAAGNKEAGGAFKALGINVLDAAGNTRKADDIFAEVADRFQEFEDGPEKSAIALKLFSKAGADLIPLLNDGGAALRKNVEYFKQYSGVTQQVAEDADAFNDTLEKIRLLSGAAGNTIASDLLPSLQVIADEIVRFKESGDGFKGIADGITSLFKVVVSAGADVGFVLLSIGREIAAVAASLVALANFDVDGFNAISDAVKEDGKRARKELDDFKRRLNTDLGSLPQASYSNEGRAATKTKRAAPRLTDTGAESEEAARLKKNLDGQVKLIQEFASQQKEAFEFANKYLDGVYASGTISLERFFADEKTIRDANLQAQLDSYDKQIKALQDFRAKTGKGADRQDADNKIAEAQQKRAGAVQKAAQDEIIAEQARQRAIRDTQDQYTSFIATVDKLKGDDAGAAALDIAKQVRDAGELVAKAGGDPKLVQQYQAQLEGIAALTAAQKEYGKLLEQQSKTEQNLLLDAQNSGAGELATLAGVRDSRQQAITQLADMAAKAQAVADTLNTDESKKFADDLALAFRKANAEIDPLAQKFNAIFENQFGDAFSGFITGSTSAKDAFKQFASSVISDIARIASQQLAQTIFGQSNGQGGIGALLSGLFGSGSAGSTIAGNDIALAFADGGRPPVGRASLVGEKGPELFVPNTSGTIVPNHLLGGGSGGDSTSVQVLPPPGMPISAQASTERQPDGSKLIKLALTAFQADVRNGGGSWDAIAGRGGLKPQLPRRGR